MLLLDAAPPETLARYRAELGSVSSLCVVLLHAEGDALVARDVGRARPTGLDAEFWHGRIRALRHHMVRQADSYDHVHDTGTGSAEQSAAKSRSCSIADGAAGPSGCCRRARRTRAAAFDRRAR